MVASNREILRKLRPAQASTMAELRRLGRFGEAAEKRPLLMRRLHRKAAGLDLQAIKQTYRRYAGFYDTLFGRILEPGRRAAVALADVGRGQRILEIGVGTGLSLPAYRDDSRVVGIDICAEMLERARQRVDRQKLGQVEALLEMDAQALELPNHSFDAVVAMYTASVVPCLENVIAEMRRVCVPGGRIVVVNHFASRHPLLRRFEGALAPLSGRLGFRPDLDLEQFVGMMELEPIDIRRANLFGYWRLVSFRNALRSGDVDLRPPTR
jgi:phosphatidylethanolamine/phosphatidyl-N-methylethanolamine N-methyltransferase